MPKIVRAGGKYIVESLFHPVLFNSIQEPGKKYMIAEGLWEEVPAETTYENIVWFRKHYGQKHSAFDTEMDFEVPGSKGKVYEVKYSHKKWSCSCEAFTFSGGRSQCKHIKQTIKDIEEGKYEAKD